MSTNIQTEKNIHLETQEVNLVYRLLDLDDLDTISEWWSRKNIPLNEDDFLLQEGIAVEVNDELIAAGLLYEGFGLDFASLGQISLNPDRTEKERHMALRVLARYAKTAAINAGYGGLVVASDDQEIISSLKSADFQEVEKGVSFLLYEPCGRA